MADKRPFAKIDTGYILNPKWFQIERALRNDDRIDDRFDYRSLVRVAREAHIASILYCAQNVTDGLFPVDVVKALVTVRPDEEPAITALFTVGMWINETGGLATVHDYLEHQTSSEKVKQLSAAGKKAVTARDANRPSNRSSDRSSVRSSEEKRREEKRKEDISPLTPHGGTGTNYTTDFNTFWAAFPSERKRAKADCQKLFTQAVKAGTPADIIIQAAEQYRADPNREPQYTVNPKTWLREQRWESGPLPSRHPTITRSELWLHDSDPQPHLQAIEGGNW